MKPFSDLRFVPLGGVGEIGINSYLYGLNGRWIMVDLGIGFATHTGGQLMVISLATGHRADGFDLVFDRWSLSIRRGSVERLVGSFRPI